MSGYEYFSDLVIKKENCVFRKENDDGGKWCAYNEDSLEEDWQCKDCAFDEVIIKRRLKGGKA